LSLVVLGGYANAILLVAFGHIHVDRTRWGRSGTVTAGRFNCSRPAFVDLSLPLLDDGRFQVQAANSRYLAFSMAWLSHHDWCGPDQTPRRLMLAGSYLPLLSLRKHSRSRVPLVAIFTLRRSGSKNSGRDGTILSNWSCRGFLLVHDTCGMLQVFAVTFQIFLIISGNLSFLNYLTIIPFLACL